LAQVFLKHSAGSAQVPSLPKMGILFLIPFLAQFTIATWALQATHDPRKEIATREMASLTRSERKEVTVSKDGNIVPETNYPAVPDESHLHDPSFMQRVSVGYDTSLGITQPLEQGEKADSGDTPHGLSDGIWELANLKADKPNRRGLDATLVQKSAWKPATTTPATTTPATTTPAPTPASTPDPTPASTPSYTTYTGKNAYAPYGAVNDDSSMVFIPSGLTASQCQQYCTDDDSCDCVTHNVITGQCWRRKDCDPSGWIASSDYSVYMKAGRYRQKPDWARTPD
jgi:hypothetical protein